MQATSAVATAAAKQHMCSTEAAATAATKPEVKVKAATATAAASDKATAGQLPTAKSYQGQLLVKLSDLLQPCLSVGAATATVGYEPKQTQQLRKKRKQAAGGGMGGTQDGGGGGGASGGLEEAVAALAALPFLLDAFATAIKHHQKVLAAGESWR